MSSPGQDNEIVKPRQVLQELMKRLEALERRVELLDGEAVTKKTVRKAKIGSKLVAFLYIIGAIGGLIFVIYRSKHQ